MSLSMSVILWDIEELTLLKMTHRPSPPQPLQETDYKTGMINCAIEKARKIPRFKALKEKVQNLSDRRPVFVVTYDPRLPNIPAIQRKHWRAMVGMDQYMSEVFPEPPLTAFKRPKNIKEYLVRAKVPGLNNKKIISIK